MVKELLLFSVADIQCGLPTECVREVLRAVTISPLPDAPDAIEGIINIRGRVHPVISARQIFGLPRRSPEVNEHFIVFEWSNLRGALHVDYASDLVAVQESEIEVGSGKEPIVQGFVQTKTGLTQILSPEKLLESVADAAVFNTSAGAKVQ